MNAHDLIKEAIAEKGKFDSVYWLSLIHISEPTRH